MRPVPDPERWAYGLAHSHTLAVKITCLPSGLEITTGISGTVTLDATADIRGRLDLTIEDDGTLVPDSHDDPLELSEGQELQIERGITYPEGDTDLVSLGIFRIEDCQVQDSGSGVSIQIAGLDRSARIREAKFLQAFSIPGGTDAITQLTALLRSAYPDIQLNFPAVSKTLPELTLDEQGDPWDLCTTIAKALGMELFFDGDGICVLRPIQSTDLTPVVELSEGEDGVLLPSLNARRTRDGVSNYWIVTGENPKTNEVYRAVAVDNDPQSPTRYGGPFGSVPSWTPLDVESQDQAQDAANGLKAKGMGVAKTINFNALPNPRLEPSDVALIKRERSGVNEGHILDSLTFALGAEAMAGQTRMVSVGV